MNTKKQKLKQVVAIANQKGGVGKTTTTINLGAGLANLGYDVLLIDLDPQCNLTDGLAINPKATSYDLLLDENIKANNTINKVNDHLYVIPADMRLFTAEKKLANEIASETILKEKLDSIISNYDFILIDNPPQLSVLTLNSLTACDSVLIPINAEYFALNGLDQLTQTIATVKKRLNKSIKINGVLFTKLDNRKLITKEIVNTIQENFKDKLYKSYVRNNTKLVECSAQGLDIFSYDKRSNGAIDYLEVAKEFLERIK